MANLRATGASVLDVVSVTATAISSGVMGAGTVATTWATNARERAQTDRHLVAMREYGRRQLAAQLATADLIKETARIRDERSKDAALWDATAQLFEGFEEPSA